METPTPIKVKVVKETGYNPNFKGIKVQASRDGVPLKLIMQALVDFKDKEFLNEALTQKNVQAFAKIGHYYHPLGYIKKEMYDAYVKLITNNINHGKNTN